jgi:hypothetical protein
MSSEHHTPSPQGQVVERLSQTVGPVDAAALVYAMADASDRPDTWAALLTLFDELDEASAKAARSACEALLDLHRRGGLAVVIPWLDVGVVIAGASGAAAMRYFRESPLLLGLLDSPALRQQVLTQSLELAETDPTVVLDYLRSAPELLTVVGPEQVAAWGEVGLELSRTDYVLGIEFLKHAPSIARVLPFDSVRPWVTFAMKLVIPNSFGKPDYMGPLEFIRTSPAILGDIEALPLRHLVVAFGSRLADQDPQQAIVFLSEAPGLLRRMAHVAWRETVLQYGMLVIERDAVTALAYVRRAAELVALLGSTPEAQRRYEEWFKGGMEVLAYSIEGARAYFALESRQALAAVERALSGVPLKQVARQLRLFAGGLCGTSLAIEALPGLLHDPDKPAPRATVSADGQTIYLPAMLRRYESFEENLRLYHIMTAHEAGHVEFGTYAWDVASLVDLIADVRARYWGGREKWEGRRADPATVAVSSLADLLALYPQPALAKDVWMLLEDARVEARLQAEYPGLQADLAKSAKEAVTLRTLGEGMSVKEMVVDALLLLTTVGWDGWTMPESLRAVVVPVWEACQPVFQPLTTAADVLRVMDRVYQLMDHLISSPAPTPGSSQEPVPAMEIGDGPVASEDVTGHYRPVENWTYRGDMPPEQVGRGGGERLPEESPAAGSAGAHPTVGQGRQGGGSAGRQGQQPTRLESRDAGAGETPGSMIEELLAIADEVPPRGVAEAGDRTYLYDEWDGALRDYRPRWCRVVERSAEAGTIDFAEGVLAEYGSSVKVLRRYFEALRPEALKRVYGETDGDELDLDAVIRRAADQLAGAEPSDRLYVKRVKRARSVAVAFLVDLSGSTSRQVETSGRRVIDVEKAGLVLLSEALEAIGDAYAVYGYSGQGRDQVDFVRVKDFQEQGAAASMRRIGGIHPRGQNRDGAAIRHAVRKLIDQPARVKLLILLSDGKPLDEAYADEYALEDTKMALREARMSGVEPYCITIDREAGSYLTRMYGEVRYTIIDDASALPERLPRIYQRLTA